MNKVYPVVFFITICVFGTRAVEGKNETTSMSVSGGIDMTEFNGKQVKKWYCLLSSAESGVSSHEKTTAATGKKGTLSQNHSVHGHNYNLRSMNWDSNVEDDTFTLNFHSSATTFNESFNHDDSSCSYRVYKGKTSGGFTQFSGEGLFSVPNGAWVMRLIVDEIQESSKTNIKVTQINPESVDEKGTVIPEKDTVLDTITKKNTVHHMIYSSSQSLDNIIKIKFDHLNRNISRATDVNLKIKVQFISQNYCLSSLKESRVEELWPKPYSADKNTKEQLFKAIEKLSCFTQPQYMEFILNNIILFNIDSFFKKSYDIEKSYIQNIDQFNYSTGKIDKDVEAFLFLIRQARFSYALEIAKDIYNFLQAENDPELGQLNGLQRLRLLKFQGLQYLIGPTIVVTKIIDKNLKSKKSRPIMTEFEYQKILTLLKTFVGIEIKTRREMFDKLIVPSFLSREYFDGVETSLDKLESRYTDLKIILDSSHASTIDGENLKKMRKALSRLIVGMDNFMRGLETLLVDTMLLQEGDDVIQANRNFEAKFYGLFTTNVTTLRPILGEYFINNFEDARFQNLVMKKNGEVMSITDFIEQFEKMGMEK